MQRTNKVPLLLMLKRQYYASYFKTDLKNFFDRYLYMFTLQCVTVSYSALGNLSTWSFFFQSVLNLGASQRTLKKNVHSLVDINDTFICNK